ncbi:zinc ribbon domain-containing protein [Plectonema radiosum]|uniref:zinc ribbon domain-containing protein n=1 Tax=Plectonema radiosum TaxID=945768 RepID=UPI002AD222A0|nr:zinc ribbon domain-containing protein [Plectonema radiosum]
MPGLKSQGFQPSLYKVTSAGGFYIEVPTLKVKPSQTCPNCGHQKKKTLALREHHCEKCGYQCDRDVAAAMVMLMAARGMERTSTDDDEPASIYCGSFKQAAQMKRRKRVAQS